MRSPGPFHCPDQGWLEALEADRTEKLALHASSARSHRHRMGIPNRVSSRSLDVLPAFGETIPFAVTNSPGSPKLKLETRFGL